ncbi:hypothetical protein BLNAU_20019 [Blattamonas nauphoetae]|uniref:Uncharacterized protein n=1 Tax=Blattamonas nauphoetae TaxID=2049346 RepID=A0ABQ9WZY5_9EUKA|nr:hypothetical protein BLNAU_20019 [Blattamonas nauphoetae]
MLSKEYLLFLVSFFHSVDEAIFGLIDSTTSIPKFDDWVGCYLDNCFVLWLNDGCVWKQQKAWDEIHHYGTCHPPLKVGDCVRMEVDMDSKPQTFIGFYEGTSICVYRIAGQSKPTPMKKGRRKLNWAELRSYKPRYCSVEKCPRRWDW